MTYCVNIIENEKRRISKIGKEVEEIIESEKNSVLSEKIINKLRDITNLKNCDYAPPKSDSENNPVEETINDINMPDIEVKEFFTPENKDFIMSAELNNKDVDEMFNRASLIYEEERKFEEKKENLMFGNKEIKKETEEQNLEAKTPDKIIKYDESPSPQLEKSESPKLEQKASTEEKTEPPKEKQEEEVKSLELQIEPFIPQNISKSLEEILNFLKETCPLKYV